MNLSAPVSSIMSTHVECVTPDQKILDLKHIYEKQAFHHHIPVTENGILVGMVSLIDFMRAISNATLDDNESVYHTTLVRDVMSIHPVSVPENTTLEEIATQLAKGQFSSIVITENNHVKGIVTTADMLRFLLANK